MKPEISDEDPYPWRPGEFARRPGRRVIPIPAGLDPDLARFVEAFARTVARRDYLRELNARDAQLPKEAAE